MAAFPRNCIQKRRKKERKYRSTKAETVANEATRPILSPPQKKKKKRRRPAYLLPLLPSSFFGCQSSPVRQMGERPKNLFPVTCLRASHMFKRTTAKKLGPLKGSFHRRALISPQPPPPPPSQESCHHEERRRRKRLRSFVSVMKCQKYPPDNFLSLHR